LIFTKEICHDEPVARRDVSSCNVESVEIGDEISSNSILEIKGDSIRSKLYPPINSLKIEKTEMPMCQISPGSFTMGVDFHVEYLKDAYPSRKVHISSHLAVATIPVTNKIARQILSRFEFSDIYWNTPQEEEMDEPLSNITWGKAVDICNTLSVNQGLNPVYLNDGNDWKMNIQANGYRLLNEAEWEYIAKTGSIKSPMHERAWFKHEDSSEVEYETRTTTIRGFTIEHRVRKPELKKMPVKLKKTNIFGMYDLFGNVWEYCNDCYQNNFYSINPQSEDMLHIDHLSWWTSNREADHVLRGGSFMSEPGGVGPNYRHSRGPRDKWVHYGLRVCRILTPYNFDDIEQKRINEKERVQQLLLEFEDDGWVCPFIRDEDEE
jgi:formylglycine-generating enzyme required for sulfatase activity